MRGARGGAAVFAAVAIGLTAAAPAEGVRLKSAGFTLDGTHGYTITVSGQLGSGVSLSASKKSGSAIYDAPGRITKTKIKANLGRRGEVKVRFHPKGEPEKNRCGPVRSKVQRGIYKGRIRFTGERGFTKVRERKAKGQWSVTTLSFRSSARGNCGGGPVPASTQLRAYTEGSRVGFIASKATGQKARFSGFINERAGRVEIFRSAFAKGAAGSFTFDDALTQASVDPPAPFSGTATYTDGSPPTWAGNLAMKVPGKKGKIALAGPSFTNVELLSFD